MITPIRYTFITVGIDPRRAEWLGHPLYTIVNNRSNERIAELLWYAPWHRYIARFDPDSVWSADCLADVQDALAKTAGK
jgi:hypothetical protein